MCLPVLHGGLLTAVGEVAPANQKCRRAQAMPPKKGTTWRAVLELTAAPLDGDGAESCLVKASPLGTARSGTSGTIFRAISHPAAATMK